MTHIKYFNPRNYGTVVFKLPSELEQRQWVYHVLRKLYFEDKAITLSQYRSCKGNIRTDLINALNFLQKRVQNIDVWDKFNKFKNTKRQYYYMAPRANCKRFATRTLKKYNGGK